MIFHILFLIFSYDVWFYISHIILHKKIFYTLIHKDHHLVDYNTMIFTDAYVGHFVESLFQGVGVFFPLLFIQFNPYSLIYALLIINARGMLRHDRRFIWLIGNHHILHHKYPKYNFGEYWLDVTFGTLCPEVNQYKRGIIYM